MNPKPILEVKNLSVDLEGKSGVRPVVRDASLSLSAGSWLGIVGESGCGKSILTLAILGLLPRVARVCSGQVFYEGKDLLRVSARDLESIRGSSLSVVFQNALTALNPLFTAGDQVAAVHRKHRPADSGASLAKAIEMFRALGLSDPERTARMYPHQLSGGMAQRVMLAMALIGSPRLLIADDPTSTLDPTIQAQVLELLIDEVRKRQMAMLLISRDIRLVSAVCAEMAVMSGGEIVEFGPTSEIIVRPVHEYTRRLLEDAELLTAIKDGEES